MRCDACQRVIEEYFDGELNEQAALQVRHHLDSCPECSKRLRELNAEEDVYSGYKSEVEISPELWTGIQARIASGISTAPSPRSEELQPWLSAVLTPPRVSVWAALALLIAAIGLTAVFMRYVVRPDQHADVQPASERQSSAPSALQEKPALASQDKTPGEASNSVETAKKAAPKIRTESISVAGKSSPLSPRATKTRTPEQLVREAEQKYLAAIAMLARTAERKRSGLDPETRAKLDQALVSIDRTIANTRRVVQQHPADPIAVQYMLTAYAKKVEVLRELVDY